MSASRPLAKRTIMLAVSYASGPGRSRMSGETQLRPEAKISVGSEAMRKRAMSRSWIAMSVKMPPPPATYEAGGGAGSREQSLTTIGSPISPRRMPALTRWNDGSKRRCSAVMSFKFSRSIARIAAMVSESVVASGFSQKTCFPARAHAWICSAWTFDGEQIHTASTSGCSMTSCASAVQASTPNIRAASSALSIVGLDTMTTRAPDARDSVSKCTRPMRPHPMTPTPITPRSSRSFWLVAPTGSPGPGGVQPYTDAHGS
mmetsp:Transcript_23148/g.91839  ORF Transcript_23148/g.91839 Transcript_23148/m.91839 type:complete len:260 (-) Transcript_23148:397-1176(-)